MTYWQSAPAYSDEIAQAFHLFPYSPQSPAAPTVFIQFSDKSATTIIAPSLSDGNHFLVAEKTAEIIVFYFSSAKTKAMRANYGFTERMAEPDNAFIVYTGLKMEKKYRENRTIRKQQTIPTVKNTEEQY